MLSCSSYGLSDPSDREVHIYDFMNGIAFVCYWQIMGISQLLTGPCSLPFQQRLDLCWI